MRMYRFLLPVFFASSVLYAAETNPMAKAYESLLNSLTQETEALEKIEEAGDVAGVVGDVRAALAAQKELLVVDAKELWLYIDNTEGKKQPLIDVLERLAIQFGRLEKTNYFDSADLKALLSSQIEENPEAAKAKREKIHAVDYDED